MDPPRCHRLCDLFGTCSAFCVCFLRLPFASASASAFAFASASALVLGPPLRRGRSVWLGKELSAFAGRLYIVLRRCRRLSVFFAFRFTFQDFARKLTSLLGRVPRLWTRLIALSPAPARLSRLPSSRSSFLGGLLPGKGSGY